MHDVAEGDASGEFFTATLSVFQVGGKLLFTDSLAALSLAQGEILQRAVGQNRVDKAHRTLQSLGHLAWLHQSLAHLLLPPVFRAP